MIHKLKLLSKYYDDSEKNIKTFEIRKNDRNFKVGDILKLIRCSTIYIKGEYKGEIVFPNDFHYKQITYILDDKEYLQNGYICLGLQPVPAPESFEGCSEVKRKL